MNRFRSCIIKTQIVLIFIIVVTFLGFVLFFPNESKNAVRNGLVLCGEIIIPSLFPFTCGAMFIFSTRLAKVFDYLLKIPSKLLFNSTSSVGTVFLMSLLGGFPVGAKLIAKLYNDEKINTKSANLLLTFCINGGPGFIIVAVGTGFLRSQTAGIILFISSVISATIIGISVTRKNKIELFSYYNEESISYSEGLIRSISDTGYSMIGISFFVVAFSVISSCLSTFLPDTFSKIITSFFEVTNGSLSFSKFGIAPTGLIIGFSGFAIHFQIFGICRNITINYKYFYLGRIIHGLLTMAFSFIIEKIFPISRPTVNFSGDIISSVSSSGATLSLIIMSSIMMIYVYIFYSERRKA